MMIAGKGRGLAGLVRGTKESGVAVHQMVNYKDHYWTSPTGGCCHTSCRGSWFCGFLLLLCENGLDSSIFMFDNNHEVEYKGFMTKHVDCSS